MRIILSAAISLDGYLDDCSSERLRLSSPQDWEAVLRLRAGCDAILVGAGTIRKDNPALLIREETLRRERLLRGMEVDIVKVTLSRSGQLDPGARFFTEGRGRKIVFVPDRAEAVARAHLGGCADIVSAPVVTARQIADALAGMGYGTLMVEGGGAVLSMFLAEGVADELRLAVAPFFVGEPEAPRWVTPGEYPWGGKTRLRLESVQMLGDTAVMYYKNNRDDCKNDFDDRHR